MVYDWDGHQHVCRRLYVEEKRSLDEIVEVLRDHHNFTPSKRALLSHFRQWGFPSKQNPAYKNEALVDRIRELWETNVVQKEMLRILQDEGFDISTRELSRVRTKNRWLLREPTETRNQKTRLDPAAQTSPPPRRQSAVEGAEPGEDTPADNNSGGEILKGNVADATAGIESVADGLDRAQQAWREQRRRALAAESAEKWAAKKRRRRTRDWAGLPADPPGPPRFPSETTLEESKAILGLNSELYGELRQRFQVICEGAGVIKKTIAGPEKWEAVKEQLVREMTHLRSLLWEKDGMDSKKLAIDVICCDVTKRMRVAGKKMTLAQAKNILGMNPEEGRNTRFAFYRILAADQFTGKLASGQDHWDALKHSWLAGSELLQRILASEDAVPSRDDRLKAIDMLARDVRKRYRDDVLRGQAKGGRAATDAPADAGAKQAMETEAMDDNGFPNPDSPSQTMPLPNSRSPASHGRRRAQDLSGGQARLLPTEMIAAQPDMSSIDPDLGSSMLMPTDGQSGYAEQQYVQQYAPAPPAAAYHAAEPSATFAIYFRLHPSSTISAVPPMWISTLGSRSVEELRGAAVAKFPGAVCLAIEGLVKDGKGGEVPLQIHGDGELEAYLAHVQEMQGAPSFSVHLVRGWNAG